MPITITLKERSRSNKSFIRAHKGRKNLDQQSNGENTAKIKTLIICTNPEYPEHNGMECFCIECRGFQSCLGACFRCEKPAEKPCGACPQ